MVNLTPNPSANRTPLPPQLREREETARLFESGLTPEEALDELFERRKTPPLGLCPILNNRNRRRDRKTWWTIDDSGFLLTPRTIPERAKRAIAAIVRARSLNSYVQKAFDAGKIRRNDKQTLTNVRRWQSYALRSQRRLARVIAGNPVFREPVTLRERFRLFLAYLSFAE